jgi:hypothetical protein
MRKGASFAVAATGAALLSGGLTAKKPIF